MGSDNVIRLFNNNYFMNYCVVLVNKPCNKFCDCLIVNLFRFARQPKIFMEGGGAWHGVGQPKRGSRQGVVTTI